MFTGCLRRAGINKVTFGVNNPTGLHYDDKNVLVTATLVFGLHGLRGGSHVLMGIDRAAAVIVHECAEGTLIVGDYAHALHGNLATIAGNRLIHHSDIGHVMRVLSRCADSARTKSAA
eukprot:5034028-Prymnesium_polylepis.1